MLLRGIEEGSMAETISIEPLHLQQPRHNHDTRRV
jgi:hypothetical protein